MRLHRWEYIADLRLHKCVDADIGGVDSGQWCWPGCGAIVTMRELYSSRLPAYDRTALHVSLDILANRRDRPGKLIGGVKEGTDAL